MVVDFYFWIRA
jgi:hypothetical protein